MNRFAIGIDLGGTHARGARVFEDGRAEEFVQVPARAGESAAAPLQAIGAIVAGLIARRDEAVGVGVGSPGVIDPASGAQIGRTAHFPHWEDFALRAELERRLGLPVTVDNDANLAALAEHHAGAARGARVSITITIGTGVGCGIVVGGEVLRGAHGGAGEIGHVPLGDGSFPCRCGVERCVEPEMSGAGLARRAESLGLVERDAAALFAAAARGDGQARALVDRLADRLGAAVGTAVNLLNPDVVVIGGGVAQAGETLLGPFRSALERYALASHRRGLRVVPAALGVQAGVIGAGIGAWRARATKV